MLSQDQSDFWDGRFNHAVPSKYDDSDTSFLENIFQFAFEKKKLERKKLAKKIVVKNSVFLNKKENHIIYERITPLKCDQFLSHMYINA